MNLPVSVARDSRAALQPDILSLRGRASIIAKAFLAILRRDLLVTWRNLFGVLIELLLQPIFFLLIFGKVLPTIGLAQQEFGGLLLPGIVALTILMGAIESVTLPLVLDLGYAREIDDRLLAPLPVSMVALEKVLFATVRGLIGGVVIFPLAYVILGGEYQVRVDDITTIVSVMVLTALVGASLGLFVGTVVKPERIGILFSIIFTPLMFLGCTYYPWYGLAAVKWFQILTLLNPMTYASEGLRSAMALGPGVSTLALGWVLLGLCTSAVVFLVAGIKTFHKRVVM